MFGSNMKGKKWQERKGYKLSILHLQMLIIHKTQENIVEKNQCTLINIAHNHIQGNIIKEKPFLF